MSFGDLTHLLDILEDLNVSIHDEHENVSHLETEMCVSSSNQSAVLYSISILYIFIFLIGLAANAVVVWVNLRAKRHLYETHLYILNLAIADLCVVATLPVWVSSLLQHGNWPFGGAMCKITHLVFSVNLFSSIFFLTCMSVDRYLSVVFFGDSSSHGKKVVRRLICVLVWLLALAASLPESYFLDAVKTPHSDHVQCKAMYPGEPEWTLGIQLSFMVLGFAIPFPIICVFYILLAGALSSSTDPERCLSRKIIFTYIVVFLVCWLPYHGVLLTETLAILNVLPFSCRLDHFLSVALQLTQCLSLVHCCINPIIYNFINKHYRYDLMKAFIFKYSNKTGLAKLIDTSRVSETEYSAVDGNHTPL